MSDNNNQNQASIDLSTSDFKISISTKGPDATQDVERLLNKIFEWINLEEEN